jgi:Flp pilus assembly pilin Flp
MAVFRTFISIVIRGVFGPVREEITGSWEKLGASLF